MHFKGLKKLNAKKIILKIFALLIHFNRKQKNTHFYISNDKRRIIEIN